MIDMISTDFRDVLAATSDSVILRGRHYTADEPVDCVVHVSRELYFAAVSEWLDQKSRYYVTQQTVCRRWRNRIQATDPAAGHRASANGQGRAEGAGLRCRGVHRRYGTRVMASPTPGFLAMLGGLFGLWSRLSNISALLATVSH